MRGSRLLTYENGLLLMPGLTFGVVFMDRAAVNYLAPFLIMGGCSLAAGLLGLGLKETPGTRPADPQPIAAPVSESVA